MAYDTLVPPLRNKPERHESKKATDGKGDWKLKRQNKDRKKKNKGLKPGAIAFGTVALIYAAIFPLYRISDFLLCGALAFLVGKIIGVMGSGLDLTTHNKQDADKKAQGVEELPLSGNENADAVIAKGQEMLHQIRAENDAIPDEVLSGQMDELEHLCVQIFKTVAEKPQKATQIRKFMNYYLPTTLKMLASYRTMNERGVSVSDMTEARSTLIRGMGMVLTACQKQLDNLYKDTMLDVTTDIDVLEQMLKRDGFTQEELGRVTNSARTAAAAQLQRTPEALHTPKPQAKAAPSGNDDFVSFYDRQNQK